MIVVRCLDPHSPQGCQPRRFIYSAGRDLRLRTRRLRSSTWNTIDTTSLYWFRPPESKTLRPVLDCIALGGLQLWMTWPQGFGLVCLMLADRQGRWAPSLGRLQQGNRTKENNIIS
jgi:hypothetical protein